MPDTTPSDLVARRPREAATLATAVGGLIAFVTLRWAVAAHREISRFVVAGAHWVRRPLAPRSLYVFAHTSGYDGQFYWRLAADPFDLSLHRDLGVRLDNYYRLNRILYPLLAWIGSLGHVAEVSWALVVVNGLAVVSLVVVGLVVARHQGLPPTWALGLLLVPGLVGALSRDLTEATTCAFALASFAAWRAGRFRWSGVALAAAVLTRETMLVVVAVYAFAAVADRVRQRPRPPGIDAVWTLPLVVFALWQVAVVLAVGHVPILSSAGSGDIGVPFVGFVTSLPAWVRPFSLHQLVKCTLYVIETAGMLWLFWLGWRARAVLSGVERAVIGVLCLLVALETKQGWQVPLDARYAAVPMVLIWFELLVSGDQKTRRRALLLGPVVAVSALWRIAVI